MVFLVLHHSQWGMKFAAQISPLLTIPSHLRIPETIINFLVKKAEGKADFTYCILLSEVLVKLLA